MLVDLPAVRVNTGLSTHVHINNAEYYNDSTVSHPRKGHSLLAFIDLTIIVHAWGTCDFNESGNLLHQSSPVIVNGSVYKHHP